jgi:FixJ family two-component response regulator
MLPSGSHGGHRFIASDVTPETASRTLRRNPVLAKTSAESMPELSVVIIASDNDQRKVLQGLVDGTGVARTVHTCATYPVAVSDPLMSSVRAANPVVTLVDIPADNAMSAQRAIELLHQEMPDAAIFAIGNLNQPWVIVNAMRAGAREFIERPTTTTDLLEAFVRLTAPQHRHVQDKGQRGKVLAVANAIREPRRQTVRRDFGPLIGLCLIILAWFPPLLLLVFVTSLLVFGFYRLVLTPLIEREWSKG